MMTDIDWINRIDHLVFSYAHYDNGGTPTTTRAFVLGMMEMANELELSQPVKDRLKMHYDLAEAQVIAENKRAQQPPPLHEQLKAVVHNDVLDYKPWGMRDREEPEWEPDCSCGCKHFAALEGNVGMDWGVCTSPISHRRGLLTFEHQGCPQYEAGPDTD